MEATVTVKPTPKEMAEMLWDMGSDEQAEMFHEMIKASGGEHDLMMQFLDVRVECESRKKEDYTDCALDGFLVMFSSAYKYMSA